MRRSGGTGCFAIPRGTGGRSTSIATSRSADERVGRMVDQINPDITAFKARGGKAIVYQGWQDPVVNALDTIAYYEQVRSRQGSQQETDGFFRLFMVPGMGHCAGGTGRDELRQPERAGAGPRCRARSPVRARRLGRQGRGAVAARRLAGRQWRHGSHAATLRVSLEGHLCRHRQHRRRGQLRVPIAAAVIGGRSTWLYKRSVWMCGSWPHAGATPPRLDCPRFSSGIGWSAITNHAARRPAGRTATEPVRSIRRRRHK